MSCIFPFSSPRSLSQGSANATVLDVAQTGGHKKRVRRSSFLNAKKLYEDAQMARKVKQYLSNLELEMDEESLQTLSLQCEPATNTCKFPKSNCRLVRMQAVSCAVSGVGTEGGLRAKRKAVVLRCTSLSPVFSHASVCCWVGMGGSTLDSFRFSLATSDIALHLQGTSGFMLSQFSCLPFSQRYSQSHRQPGEERGWARSKDNSVAACYTPSPESMPLPPTNLAAPKAIIL